MTTVFCRVTADLSEQFVQMFPHQYDFQGLLQKIAEDAGVKVSSSHSTITQNDTAYCLQGLWPEMEKAYNMLACVYGSISTIRCESESLVSPGSRPFSALVEAAEAISRGADLQEQVDKEHAQIEGKGNEGFPPEESTHKDTQNLLQENENLTNDNETNIIVSYDNFTKLKDRNMEPFDIQTDNSSIPVVFTEEEGDYTFKNDTYMYNISGHEKVNDKIDIDESVTGGAFKESSNLSVHHDQDNLLKSEEELLKLETKKSVFVKKRKVNTSTAKNMGQPEEDPPKSTKASPTKKKRLVGEEKMPIEKEPDNNEHEIEKPLKVKDAMTQLRTSEEDYACEYCDFVGKNRKAFSDHTQLLHLGKPTKCDICNKVFPNERYMKRHRDTHCGPNYRCDQCGKMYKIQRALQNHIKKHDATYKAPEFQCDMCHKSFCNNYILECHKKSEHLGIKRSFLCSTCGKSFTTKHTLQQHINLHIGARPHKCEKCGKSFTYESALRDHKLIHDGKKQFFCSDPYCNKAFRQRSALRMHEKIHKVDKDFICRECGRGFTQKQALQRHMRAHKGDKPFSCKLCGRSFGDPSIIRRHIILVHKINKDPAVWKEDIIENLPQSQKDDEVKPHGTELDIDATGNPVADSISTVTAAENLQDSNTHAITSQAKTPLPQPELPLVSDTNIKYKMYDGPFQILHIPVSEPNHHMANFAKKDQPATNTDENAEELALHYPTISLLPANLAPTHSGVFNYEYIVTPDDPTYSQAARTSETDQTITEFGKTAVTDNQTGITRTETLPKHHGRVEMPVFDTSNLTLTDTTAVTHLTDSSRELSLPEVSTVLSGTSSQEDLMAVQSLDQIKVHQEVLTAEKIVDIAKQLQEANTTVLDSHQLQQLYSYYGALANQYMNLAQLSTIVPTSDSDHQ